MSSPARYDFEAIGTSWSIEIFQPITATALKDLQVAIARRIDNFDRTYSRFRPDSLVTKISHSAGKYAFPPDGQRLFDIYESLYALTAGAITPLIGQTLSDAGYDTDYSLQTKKMTSPPSWQDAMSFNAPYLTTNRPILLDFGAAGKGYLVDLVSQLIKDQGYEYFCAEAGGDIYCNLAPESPLRIGLEDPANPNQAIGVVALSNGSICGSSGNRRTWGRFHHILDPFTLQSPQTLQAVWVTARDCLTADALATALYFIDPQKLQAEFDFEYALLEPDNHIESSPNFPAEFFIKESK